MNKLSDFNELSNFLEETLRDLSKNDKSESDVKCVINLDNTISWEEFKGCIDFFYDNDYGSQRISFNLKILGDTWWLERGESDGAECWNYKEYPSISDKPLDFEAWKSKKLILIPR